MSEAISGSQREFIRDVGSTKIVVILDTKDLMLGLDLREDAEKVMSSIGLVATLTHDAQYEYDVADADYRHWRENNKAKILAQNPKLAEWKVKSQVEAHTRFISHKTRIATRRADQEFLKVYFQGLKMKADMVRALIYRRQAQESAE